LSREFGYDEEYVDWQLDMDRLFTHFEYLKDNPPIGTLFKQFIEAKYGNKKGKRSNNPSSSSNDEVSCDGGQPRPKSFKNDDERMKWERFQLNELIKAFGCSGGIVRKGKKGGE
jgi:hypothetical protein